MVLELDRAVRERVGNLLSRGDAVLFTGAGFSTSARTRTGVNLPTVEELRRALWPLAFGDSPIDEDSTLGDVFDVASRRAGGATKGLLDQLLRVHADSLPEIYQTWFSMPWLRVWTLNVDDLDAAVGRKYRLPRRIHALSAISDPLPEFGADLLVVHLNGDLDDYPNLTFSQRQYGERTALPDPWYAHLVSDIASRPVFFVGTRLDEPSLWQHMALRGARGRGGRELRPGSFLISPHIPAAREAMLEELNIRWIKSGAEEFAEEILTQFADEASEGLAMLQVRAERVGGPPPVQRVAELMAEPTREDLAEFLLGREPVWGDLTDGFAVVREFENPLLSRLTEGNSGRILIITGTAGSGKSVTLMRLALNLQADGKEVVWIDTHHELPLWRARQAIAAARADVVVIDDVDSLGDATPGFLTELLDEQENLTILGAARSTRYVQLHIEERLADVGAQQLTVPNLEDSDIELLIDALDRGKRLGRLRGLTHEQRVRAFQERAGRQLLVAMVEATSGERFDEKIDRECRELTSETLLVYAVATIATTLREYVTKDEILLAVGAASNEELNHIQELLRQRLLLETESEIRVRHRYVSDRVVSFLQRERLVGEPMRGLLFAIASKTRPEEERHSRDKRFLVKLLNHDVWLRLAGVGAARSAYTEVEGFLAWDYHYWLQRGSLEVEVGDLRMAENFLEQARGLQPDDAYVETEWAYLNLKWAASEADAPGSDERAARAIEALEDSISRRGRADSYPFHVLASQGLSWVRRARLVRERKVEILSQFLELLRQGVKWHPYRDELRKLEKDVQAEYLGMAVQNGGSQPG